MVNESSPDDPMEIWQSQQVEPLMMSMDEIRSKAVRFERQIRTRNRRETTVALVMIVVFGLFLYVFPSPMERAGSLLTIAGLVFVIYRMNRQAAPEDVPAGGGFESCVAFHRRELERQRDLLRSIGTVVSGSADPGRGGILPGGDRSRRSGRSIRRTGGVRFRAWRSWWPGSGSRSA